MHLSETAHEENAPALLGDTYSRRAEFRRNRMPQDNKQPARCFTRKENVVPEPRTWLGRSGRWCWCVVGDDSLLRVRCRPPIAWSSVRASTCEPITDVIVAIASRPYERVQKHLAVRTSDHAKPRPGNTPHEGWLGEINDPATNLTVSTPRSQAKRRTQVNDAGCLKESQYSFSATKSWRSGIYNFVPHSWQNFAVS